MFNLLKRRSPWRAFSTSRFASGSGPEQLRIGYQKGSVSMVLAKSHPLLESSIRGRKFRGLNFLPCRKSLRR